MIPCKYRRSVSRSRGLRPGLLVLALGLWWGATATCLGIHHWVGGVDGQWSTPGNWQEATVPGASDAVVFEGSATADCEIDVSTTVASLTLDSAFSYAVIAKDDLTVSGNASLGGGTWKFANNTAGSLSVGGNLTIAATVECQYRSLTGNGTGRVFTVGTDLLITTSGVVNAHAMGFIPAALSASLTPSAGPGQGLLSGNGGPYYGSGAGHGGQGGDPVHSTLWKSGGIPYGSFKTPTSLGSGGGWGHYAPTMGYGGGAVKFVVAGDTTLDGTIDCGGRTSVDSDGNVDWDGGGAGGSVWFDCIGDFGGAGTITVNGGAVTSYGGGGAGGRIAVHYGTLSFTGTLTAFGGAGSTYDAAAGTLYLKLQSAPTGTLIVDNNNLSRTPSPTLVTTDTDDHDVGTLVLRNNAKFQVATGERFTLYGNLTNDTAMAVTGGEFLLADTGRVSVLSGTSGQFGFYQFTCTNAGKRIQFAPGATIQMTDKLTLVGSTSAVVELRSTAASAWSLALPTMTHDIQYVDVQYSDASGGAAVEAFSSVDSGFNTNWSFAVKGQTNTWTGLVSADIRVDGNWSLGRQPVAADRVVIPGGAPNYPSLDNNREFATLTIQSGGSLGLANSDLMVPGDLVVAGALTASGTETVTLGADTDMTGGTLTPAQSTFELAGQGTQSVTSDGQTFATLRVSNTNATVTFTDAFSAAKLYHEGTNALFQGTVNCSTSLDATSGNATFQQDVTVGALTHTAGALTFDRLLTVTDLAQSGGDVTFGGGLQAGTFYVVEDAVTLTFATNTDINVEWLGVHGSASDAVTMVGSDPGGVWRLNATNCLYASYVDVQGCEASGGVEIRAVQCTDSGNNTHWRFYDGNEARVWTGAASTSFGEDANWSPTGAPDATLVAFVDGLSAVTPRIAAAAAVSNLYVGGPQTATLLVDAPLTVGENLQVLPNGVLSHTANFAPPATYGMDLTVGGDLVVFGELNVYRKGYRAATSSATQGDGTGYGPGGGRRGGNGGPYYGSGAGYGGHGGYGGGSGYVVSGGTCYGSIEGPVDPGSGGGFGHYTNLGDGGGVIKCTVAGRILCEGSILSNGGQSELYPGGGSGGSIWLICDELAGSGTISADGAISAGAGGGGGGGRIAVYYGSLTFDGALHAYGGWNGYGSGPYAGAAGTLFLKQNSAATGTIVLDNGGQASTQRTQFTSNVVEHAVDNLWVRNSARPGVPAGETLTLRGGLTNDAAVAFTSGTVKLSGSTVRIGGTSATTTFYDLVGTNAGTQVDIEGGHRLAVSHVLTLAGETGTPVTLRSTDASAWQLQLSTETHSIQRVDVANSDASPGTPAQANFSTDSGGNTNWIFVEGGADNTWIGAADAVWANGANWDLGRQPTADDTVVVSNGCSFYPTLDNPKEFVGFRMNAGSWMSLGGYNLLVTGDTAVAGALVATGTETVTLRGDIDFTGGSFTQATSALVLDGASSQSFTAGGCSFATVLLHGRTGTVTVTDALEADALNCYTAQVAIAGAVTVTELQQEGGSLDISGTLQATHLLKHAGDLRLRDDATVGRMEVFEGGVALTFEDAHDYAIGRLLIHGSETNLVTLRSATPGAAWRLVAAACSYVSYVDAQDCDASGGVQIRAVASQDSGRNVNWWFVPTSVGMVWSGASGTSFSDAGNWSPSRVPSAGQFVVIDGRSTVTPVIGQAVTVSNLLVGGAESATLVVNKALTADDSITVLANGTLTHSGNNYPPMTYGLVITAAQDVVVLGAIDVTAKGYRAASNTSTDSDGHGPGGGHRGGNGGPYYGSGGGYGGAGGRSSYGDYLAYGGGCYGSIDQPVDPGSGGGYGHYTSVGHGGGVIRLVVAGAVLCDGAIRADGGHSEVYPGGGSGGSLWLTCGELAGGGELSVSGGVALSSSGDGGGGRMALYYDTMSFTGTVTAASGGTSLNQGGSGTIYTKPSGEVYGTLSVTQGGVKPEAYTQIDADVTGEQIGDVSIGSGCLFQVLDGGELSLYGNWTNAGTVACSTGGVVRFEGEAVATLSGNNTFGVLAQDGPRKTLTFQAGSTTRVRTAMRMVQTTLRSTHPGTPWLLDLDVASVEGDMWKMKVQDSDASPGEMAAAYRSEDRGGNTNWLIVAPRGTAIQLR